jgi:hypothetical protein
LAAGGTMPFYPGAPMTVAVADPLHALVLWQATSGGKAIDPAGPWGDDHVAWSWAFVLEPRRPPLIAGFTSFPVRAFAMVPQ